MHKDVSYNGRLDTNSKKFKISPIYLYTYKTLIVLIDCMLEAVRTNPGYGMAALIHNFWHL